MKITISRGATVNLGNYESARLDVSFEATGGDEISAGELNELACSFLEEEVGKVQKAAGLPEFSAKRFTGR